MSKTNISIVSDDVTASTRVECARQRARRLSSFGVKRVIELCVGPGLKTLEDEYKVYGIECTGNDIDTRWLSYYRTGKWLFGDVLKLAGCGALAKFDIAVFAPPLTEGCTGLRNDALRLFDVRPSYIEFVDQILSVPLASRPRMLTLVLHGRVWSSPTDRSDYHRLLSELWARGCAPNGTPLHDGCRKYVDVDVSLIQPDGWSPTAFQCE